MGVHVRYAIVDLRTGETMRVCVSMLAALREVRRFNDHAAQWHGALSRYAIVPTYDAANLCGFEL
jgi:hypothetical protein